MKRLIVILITFTTSFLMYASQEQEFSKDIRNIETIIKTNIERGIIPGVAVVVIKDGNVILERGYGFANLENQDPVSLNTMFELGSTTKAFTGFAIIKLAEENKIDLNAPIESYLPWFSAFYNGTRAMIRVQDCINHTSGIPFHTIAQIKSSSHANSLEDTVKRINGISLNNSPSTTKFEYATINYDILGLIIQEVTQQPYVDYMKREILEPLGLTFTTFNRHESLPKMATGYKFAFMHPVPYDAPIYQGNTPAGYLLSSIDEIKIWLLHQINENAPYRNVFEKSQIPNRTLSTFQDDAYYAAGWFTFNTEQGEVFSHFGQNPNFSSYFSFFPKQKIAVGVLANMSSNYTMIIGQSIISSLIGLDITLEDGDFFQNIDFYSTIIFMLCIVVLFPLGYACLSGIRSVANGSRIFRSKMRLWSLIISGIAISTITYGFICLPNLVLWGLNWDMVLVWGPISLLVCLYCLYLTIVMSIFYTHFLFLFPNGIKNMPRPHKDETSSTKASKLGTGF